MREAILGISAYYHDSAATLLLNGELIAAAQEERFSRLKNDSSFPEKSIQFVLEEAGISHNDITAVAFYDKPLLKFERLLETYHGFAPNGIVSFSRAMPIWLKEKLFFKKMLKDELKKLGISKIPILFPEHHLSHAASAFYPSPFNEAAILTIDGVGEWATTTISRGKDNGIKIIKELHFPHSLGLLYSSFTYYLGFKVNSGEYKLMGLAPYGNPQSSQTREFEEKIVTELIDIRDDGSFLLNMEYFNFAIRLKMTNDAKWEKLFGVPPRIPESGIDQTYMNLARAIQNITELVIIKLAETAKSLTNSKNLVMAGGVALNCVANGKLSSKKIFENIWIQPAAGDAGGSLGAAYAAWHIWKGKARNTPGKVDSMKGAYLGPKFSNKQILRVLKVHQASYEFFEDTDKLCEVIAEKISEGKIVGWFQGRMEFGPRSLGNRSILADPGNAEMQKTLNLKIKFRESFRPFAPSALLMDVQNFFMLDRPSPYMLFVAKVRKPTEKVLRGKGENLPSPQNQNKIHCELPSVTHVDFTARVQSVSKKGNPRFWKLLKAFKKKSGYGVLVNTSFNVRGQPIVCSPEEAFNGFMHTDMDYLVLGNYVLDKKDNLTD
ncbi:carbamoyltransferase family protein [Arenibacter algicola]|uniref:Decarbamoylnovobiocin carbamoyltransferase n=1 Tax=Arenibacter algicola TaxID=616991 RepID=A0A221US36_9FLAO|nr:carbamoyltransferase [Arenibacter algicola]ASO04122.1 decarbamoylnovobiocin carbamoyltransferase [Arenibacter algicola]